jgi:hypothetical protein
MRKMVEEAHPIAIADSILAVASKLKAQTLGHGDDLITEAERSNDHISHQLAAIGHANHNRGKGVS